MKFKSVLKVKNFWPSVFGFMIAFIILYNLVVCAVEFNLDFAEFFHDRFVNIGIWRMVIANLVGGFLYGFIFIFLQFRARIRRKEKRRR